MASGSKDAFSKIKNSFLSLAGSNFWTLIGSFQYHLYVKQRMNDKKKVRTLWLAHQVAYGVVLECTEFRFSQCKTRMNAMARTWNRNYISQTKRTRSATAHSNIHYVLARTTVLMADKPGRAEWQ